MSGTDLVARGLLRARGETVALLGASALGALLVLVLLQRAVIDPVTELTRHAVRQRLPDAEAEQDPAPGEM